MKRRGAFPFWVGAAIALAAGWIAFPRVLYQSRPQPVDFSHRVHVESGGAKCADCHQLRADGSFTGIPPLAKCLECHSVAMGSTAAEKRFLDQYATPQREIAWAVYARQPENVYFSHATHLKLAGLSCESCHGDHGRTAMLPRFAEDRITGYSREVWQRMKMDDCVACHRARGLENSCLDCHK